MAQGHMPLLLCKRKRVEKCAHLSRGPRAAARHPPAGRRPAHGVKAAAVNPRAQPLSKTPRAAGDTPCRSSQHSASGTKVCLAAPWLCGSVWSAGLRACFTPSTKRLELSRNSGLLKNSGTSSLTSAKHSKM